MGCSEIGGNDSTEVLHGEIINYNSGARMAGDVSAKTCGEICSLTQDFSLSVPSCFYRFPNMETPLQGDCSKR